RISAAEALASSGPSRGLPAHRSLTNTATVVRRTTGEFADSVATAVWWAPSSPDPYFNGLKTNSGNSSVLQCGSSNDQPHRRRGNVSRFFWAPYDSTTTGDDGADDLTWTFSETAGIW